MNRLVTIFIPFMQSPVSELWALQVAEDISAVGNKTLFFEADNCSSVLHRFKKCAGTGDMVSVSKRFKTLNQVVWKSPAVPNLHIVWGNTNQQDISDINKADTANVIADLTVMMNDYECTIIRCDYSNFDCLFPLLSENTKLVMLLSPNPEHLRKAVHIMKIAETASSRPYVWLKIMNKRYCSQDLRIFEQLSKIFKDLNVDYFQANDNEALKLLQETTTFAK